MQGRLCERVDGKIQAFPWRDWESEFPAAAAIDLQLMEWTLDQDHLYKNPLMTSIGQERINALCEQYGMAIPSLTGDCFMQAPFWKTEGTTKAALIEDFLAICRACFAVDIRMIVVPLVDNGRLDDSAQEDRLVEFFLSRRDFFAKNNVQILFECDYRPSELRRFIYRLPTEQFGINYDIGNSAGIGYDPVDEFAAYGERVLNVHVKDRMLHGTTVPLGTGNADFECVFGLLARQNYQGNVIMQTARAREGEHDIVLARYRDLVQGWMTDASAPCNRAA